MEKDKLMRIIEKNSDIEKAINSLIAKESTSILNRKKGLIRQRIVSIVTQAIALSPTLNSLSYGDLKYDFGLEFDPSEQIIAAVVSSIRLSITPFQYRSNSFAGGVKLYIQPSTYNNLLTLSIASQDIENGDSIPWLEWLLLKGDSVIVYDYSVEYGPYGRSGGAKMVQGGVFKVNPIHSGTREDNFITRALSRVSDDIANAILEEFK